MYKYIIPGGNLEIIKYCESKCPTCWNLIMEHAALGGNLEIIKYCESKVLMNGIKQ